MKRSIAILFLMCLVTGLSAQKSKVLAAVQMIDSKKYTEAKESIEAAVSNDKTSNWHRTYYAKGLLCQTAYEDGIKENDLKKTALYDDQLYVAYASYEKALQLDVRERIHPVVSKKYYMLSNHFKKLGKDCYDRKGYEEALRAFEHALLINQSELVQVDMDTSLVYNTALAAYESKNWEKAIAFLTGLHEDAYDPGVSLLLAKSHISNGDTVQAEAVLMEGVKLYNYAEPVVMYTVNWLSGSKREDVAINILNDAIVQKPDNYEYYWARGLVYRRMGKNEAAIQSLKEAAKIDPNQARLYYHLGVCYYNMGIELRENALQVVENDDYQLIRSQYLELFREAATWLEHSYELEAGNQETIAKLYQLYYQLQMKEKQDAFEKLIR